MVPTNDNTAYPLFDRPKEQEAVYDYFLARDLELAIKEHDFEQGELELEDA